MSSGDLFFLSGTGIGTGSVVGCPSMNRILL